VDLGVLRSFSDSFRSPQPSGRTLPLLSAARLPVPHGYASYLVSLSGSLFYVHKLSLLVETRWTHYLAEHTTLQNILPCVTV
jgi:hypothetical protein